METYLLRFGEVNDDDSILEKGAIALSGTKAPTILERLAAIRNCRISLNEQLAQADNAEEILLVAYAAENRRFLDGYQCMYRNKELVVTGVTAYYGENGLQLAYGLNWRGEPFDSIREDNLMLLPVHY